LIQKRRRAAVRQPVIAPLAGPEVEAGLPRFPYYSDQPISLEEALIRLMDGRKRLFCSEKKAAMAGPLSFAASMVASGWLTQKAEKGNLAGD